MKQGWEIKKLGEVCEIVGGSTPKTKEPTYWNGEYYWATPADLNGSKYISSTMRTITDAGIKSAHLQLLPIGTVLLSSRAPIGKVAITTVPMYCNQGFKNLICGNTLNNGYAYWFLSYNTDYLNSIGTGATFKEISKTVVEQIPITIPPLSEQERIVAELDLLSDVIAKKREQLKQLDTLAQSIFYDMFGDPITNEKGWETKKLGEISTSQIGITYKPEDVSDNGMGTVVLRSGNIQNSSLCFNDIIKVNKDIREDKYVKDGDILMCSRNGSFQLVGKVAMITTLKERMTYGAFMTVIRSDYQPFLFAFFKSPAFRSQLTTAKTATINQITIRMLENMQVILPPLTLQQEFASKIESIEKQNELIKQSLSEVQQLFDSRMDYYFG